jgi:ATP-binding cassette, subfamily C (CFTR/MRP), member 1
MIDGNPQVVIGNDRGSTASFYTAAHPLEASSSRQPFCGSSEGWGPFSPDRFDLTPCFLDIPVSVTAAWGVIMGAAALWLLLKKREPQPVPKNWHFYAKLVGSISNHDIWQRISLTSLLTRSSWRFCSYQQPLKHAFNW